MSHFSVYKTQITGMSKAFLIAAVTAFAKQQGMQIITTMQDYYRNSQSIDIGVKGTGLQAGIGFSVNAKGEVEVKGDSWGQDSGFNKLKMLVPNYIKAYKAAVNARLQHPAARINTTIQNKEVILEVNY